MALEPNVSGIVTVKVSVAVAPAATSTPVQVTRSAAQPPPGVAVTFAQVEAGGQRVPDLGVLRVDVAGVASRRSDR